MQEALASSAIENIVTTQDELYRQTVAEKKTNNHTVKEVLHYKDALWYGLEAMKKRPILNTNLFIKLVQIIKENGAGIRNAPGTQLKNTLPAKSYTPHPKAKR